MKPTHVPWERRALKGPVLLIVSIAVLSALVVVAAGVASRAPDSYSGPLRIASVSYAPEDPQPGQQFSVRAQIAGPLVAPTEVNLQYAAYFGTVSAGGGAMTPVGDRTYELAVPGFPDGTEVWFVVAVSTPNEGPIVSDSFTIDVGTVVRGGESGLRISDVDHTPTSPMMMETITVGATVTSRAPVSEVDIAYMAFCPARPPVGIDPEMVPVAPTRYTFEISDIGECTGVPGTVLLYRVIAVDSTGNTAVSDVGTVRFPDWETWR